MMMLLTKLMILEAIFVCLTIKLVDLILEWVDTIFAEDEEERSASEDPLRTPAGQ